MLCHTVCFWFTKNNIFMSHSFFCESDLWSHYVFDLLKIIHSLEFLFFYLRIALQWCAVWFNSLNLTVSKESFICESDYIGHAVWQSMNNVSAGVVLATTAWLCMFLRACSNWHWYFRSAFVACKTSWNWQSEKHVQTRSTNWRLNPSSCLESIPVISTKGRCVFPSLSCLDRCSGACGVELNGAGKVGSICRIRQTVSWIFCTWSPSVLTEGLWPHCNEP